MKLKIYIIPIVLVLSIWCLESKPTFGDEFVHIKVHLPNEGGDSHIIHHGSPIHAHPIVHASLLASPHKVVHHYHKRRRPSKKSSSFGKHASLLDSIIVSEVKEPIGDDHHKYLSHAEDIVKSEKLKPHVENYKFIEETKPKEIVESKLPQKHYHHHHHDMTALTASSEDGYLYKPQKPATETFKAIEGLLDDYHTNIQVAGSGYHYEPLKKQRVKSFQEPIGPSEYDFGSQEYAEHDDSYRYGSKPCAENVKTVEEAKAPHQQLNDYSITSHKRPQSELVEIVKSHKPAKSISYYNRHQHHQHFHGSKKNHAYHYKRPSVASPATSYDDGFLAGYDDVHKPIYEEYAQEPMHYKSKDSTHTKRPSKVHHQPLHQHQEIEKSKYHSNVHQDSLFDEEPAEAISATEPSSNNDDSYLPPQPELDGGTVSDPMHWSQQGSGHKATETYTGIDSYSAAHVQGVGSGGYPSPNP